MPTGEKIKEFRKRKGLTQKELGDLCGMADSAIRRYENGRANPKIETLQKIADALEVPVSELTGKSLARSYLEASPPTIESIKKLSKVALDSMRNSLNSISIHFDGTEYTEEELEEIKQFAEFIKNRRDKTQ